MEIENMNIDVFEKIKDEDRINNFLIIDAIYKANPHISNLGAEVLSKLLGVKNQGGFRYKGKTEEPNLVVLFSTGEEIYWKDELDVFSGIFLYYGDNKTPGNDMHKTNLHGNEILRYIFNLACSTNIDERKKIPPILLFKKEGKSRNVKFLGLAVPGIQGKPEKDWLTAVWGQDRKGDRFQNYKAYFTILDTQKGSEYSKNDSKINLAWLNDIEQNKAFESEYAPIEWKNYILNKKYSALLSTQEKYVKSKEEQLPDTEEKKNMLKILQQYFYQKDRGYSFEGFAADLIENMNTSIINVEVTSPYKDGGFDAIGKYKIFSSAEKSVLVDFYLQAKCYKENNPVVVKDTSRLISRIKNRQFGIMFTTSYIASQAYKEILEDGHPIVIINGKNIIDYLFDDLEIRDKNKLLEWLNLNYG